MFSESLGGEESLRIFTLKATSAVDGCSDAKQLVDDGHRCPLSELLTSWFKSGHVERSLERYLDEIPAWSFAFASLWVMFLLVSGG